MPTSAFLRALKWIDRKGNRPRSIGVPHTPLGSRCTPNCHRYKVVFHEFLSNIFLIVRIAYPTMDPIDPKPNPNSPPPPPQNRRRSSIQRPLAPRPSPPGLPTLAPAPSRSQSHSISPFHNSPRLSHQLNPNIIPHYPPQAMYYSTTSASYFPSADQPFTCPTDMNTLTHQNPFGSVSPVTIPIHLLRDLTYWLTVPQPYGNFDAFGFDPNNGNISGGG